MALSVRIIPCLDVTEGRVVKGVNFTDLVDAGDPVEMADLYNLEGADELTFLDISASSSDRETTLDVVRKTAEQVFIPLTVGGGIRSVEDVDRLLRAGADKVSINTSAIARPELIAEIADRFGSQVLVISIDARRARTESGSDGTRAGYDIGMISAVRAISKVPLIASGGAGTLEDFGAALDAGADALLAASVFHFGIHRISDVKKYLSAQGYSIRNNRIA